MCILEPRHQRRIAVGSDDMKTYGTTAIYSDAAQAAMEAATANNRIDLGDGNKHDNGSSLAEAELKMERHLDMIQSSDGVIDQLKRGTDFSTTLMELVAWAVDAAEGPSRSLNIIRLADSLYRQARRDV